MQKISSDILYNTQSSNEIKTQVNVNSSLNEHSISFFEMVNSSKEMDSLNHVDSGFNHTDKIETNSKDLVSENTEKDNLNKSELENKEINDKNDSSNNSIESKKGISEEDKENTNLKSVKSKFSNDNKEIEIKDKNDNKKKNKVEKIIKSEHVKNDSFINIADKVAVVKNDSDNNKDKNENNVKKINLENKSNSKYIDSSKKISVTDLRTDKDLNNVNKKNDTKLNFEVKFSNENTANINMNYASSTSDNVLSMNVQNGVDTSLNFQAMLNNSIQENVPEFVKTGSLILKDNDKGTINLILHPEELGNVKIHLSLDGKTVSGHIIVATKEALEVFKDNAQTLREAFKENGFENAEFNVSYNNNSNFGNNSSGNNFDSNEFFAKQTYEFSVDSDFIKNDNNDGINSEKKSEYSINIVA